MDGYEATRKIRASGLPTALIVPIIAVTALSYQEDVEAALNAGMNFHLEKPIKPETLLSTLVRFIK
jgi:CheY-like chemotaxis protein